MVNHPNRSKRAPRVYALSKPRYEARQLGRSWIVFDTFSQIPCEFTDRHASEFAARAEAERKAEAMNVLYERAMTS
jgi:hypothetical protein